jgi:importin-5
MSLPIELQQALQQILSALSEPNNEIRQAAEDNLNNEWVTARPDALLTGLTEQVRANEDPAVSRYAVARVLWP